MALETEGRPVGPGHALQAAVEQRDMGNLDVGRKGRRVGGKAVVLAGDQHLPRLEILDRMVGAVVAELHFQGLAAGRQRHQLMAETDAEGRQLLVEETADRSDGVVARLGIARTVGQEDAIGIHRQDIGRLRPCRHHGKFATARSQHAQNVAFDAEVVGDDVEAGAVGYLVLLREARTELPLALGPGIGRL